MKALQRSLENRHWDAKVEMWVGHIGSQVLCVAGNNTLKSIKVKDVKNGKHSCLLCVGVSFLYFW